MRYHEPWTVFPRKMAGGRTVYYFRVYLGEKRRTAARSTGCTTKSAAKDFCRKLEKAGSLIPTEKPTPKALSFGDFSENFWSWDGEYIATRLRFSDPDKPAISERTAHDYQRSLELHILPAFKRRLVETITPLDIESFSLRLRDGGLSGKRVNNITTTLRMMLVEAHRQGMLPWDPRTKGIVRVLGSSTKERGHLTIGEVAKLFSEENIETAWNGHIVYRAANYVAAATGCRQGEILALRDEDVRENYLVIAHSWNQKYGLGPTKTRKVRIVPLRGKVRKAIDPLLGSGGYVLSMSRGVRPITGNRCTEALYVALGAIGIPEEERKARNITFHSWRHWAASDLRARGVADNQVKLLTGHSTMEMLEHYTNYNPDDFAGVVEWQQEVFG